jgi:hypothetical protein
MRFSSFCCHAGQKKGTLQEQTRKSNWAIKLQLIAAMFFDHNFAETPYYATLRMRRENASAMNISIGL